MSNLNRGDFLNLAALFEGGLVAVAFLLGWLAGINPLEWLIWDWRAVGLGVLAALPMVGLLIVGGRFPLGPLESIKQFLIEVLGPTLAACRWYDLVLLALLAGFGEEILFRGVLQPWFERWGWEAGLLGSNVLFGLGHMVTPLYGLLAGAAGVYFGLLLDAGHVFDIGSQRNLLVPITTHAAYDFVGFLLVIRAYRATVGEAEEDLSE